MNIIYRKLCNELPEYMGEIRAPAVNYGIVGATLTSLATIYNKSLEEIMIIVTIRTATYVIGALINA
ncbi:unnamed protein product [Medioppia subpectinata]|uniref:Uncharacterized protein n=1 Tax=Medioppia subpectinata TaxID=1979941 RepID=A0A7R9L0Z0_9ACAR|nr:unnamed protein product [Medioppia subpectinata]CAG2112374.1 unnamed protein product [Medioppia subpectinata]